MTLVDVLTRGCFLEAPTRSVTRGTSGSRGIERDCKGDRRVGYSAMQYLRLAGCEPRRPKPCIRGTNRTADRRSHGRRPSRNLSTSASWGGVCGESTEGVEHSRNRLGARI